MTATPPLRRVVSTSAKSRLIVPAIFTRSEIPRAALLSVSSALAKASETVKSLYTSMRRWLLMTRRASTLSRICLTPSSAWRILAVPSKRKGMVTIPIVSRPACMAILPMTGAAPVPVPPPIPAVMKTMRVSPSMRASRIACSLSRAASLARSGLAPAPRPLVTVGPIVILSTTGLRSRAWVSVLHRRKDTPGTEPLVHIFVTALPPPPPTPTTLMSCLI